MRESILLRKHVSFPGFTIVVVLYQRAELVVVEKMLLLAISDNGSIHGLEPKFPLGWGKKPKPKIRIFAT